MDLQPKSDAAAKTVVKAEEAAKAEDTPRALPTYILNASDYSRQVPSINYDPKRILNNRVWSTN
jgi:hypothetical protein